MRYDLVTLDSLGGSVSFAINVNESGQASGTSLLGSNAILHAQIWEQPPHRSTSGRWAVRTARFSSTIMAS